MILIGIRRRKCIAFVWLENNNNRKLYFLFPVFVFRFLFFWYEGFVLNISNKIKKDFADANVF